MDDASPILLIMSCKAYAHKAQRQRETWLKGVPLLFFHVIGDEMLDVPFRFEGHILTVCTKDDYVSLPAKVIAAFEAVDKTFPYSHIFKTDDDQTLTDPTFFEWLRGKLSEKEFHYGGNLLKIKAHRSNYHTVHPELPKNLPMKAGSYCNGRFYLLSSTAVKALIAQKSAISKEYFEDYAVGLHLSPKLKKSECMFVFDNGLYFKDFV